MIGVEMVAGNLEGALRFLKKAMDRDQTHTLINRRLTFVTPSLRRRAKAKMAAKRRREAERKRARKESVYDLEVRRRDRGIRLFNLQHPSVVGEAK